MPTVSAPNLNLLRHTQHHIQAFASPLQPRNLWTARVNDAAIDREARTIAFNTGAGSYFSWIEEFQTVWVGSSAGLHDVGIVQVRSIASGDGGVTGTLVVEANELNWSDGDYLTFKHNYELRSMFPRLDSSFVFWKRYDIAYSNQNVNINPVCIGGPHQAGFLSGGSISFDIPIGLSYPMASGATISSRSVTVLPSTGVTVNPYAAGIITVDITIAGQYWAKCSVTDSNGKVTVTYRCLFAHEDDPSSSDYPYLVEEINHHGSWQSGGWDASFSLMDVATFEEFPDETLVVLWQRAWYGTTQTDVSILDQGTNVIVTGYLVKDTIDKARVGGGKTNFEIQTIQAKLANLPMYSISLEATDAGSVDVWYKHDKTVMDCGHILFHIYYWHSTLLQVCDFLDLDSNNILRKYADLEADDLYNMGNTLVKNNGIYAHIACNKAGQMGMKRDIVYLDDVSRAAASVVIDLDEEDLLDPLTIVHNPERRASFIFVSGFYYDGTDANPIGSTAPSYWPARVGRGKNDVERQMLSGQSHSNQLAGQIFAVENNEWPEVRATFHGNYLGVLDIFNQEWWQVDIQSGDTNRQFVWADQNMIVRDISGKINIETQEMSADVVFEPEVDGEDGVPYQWPTVPIAAGGSDPGVPDPADAANLVLTASSLYRLPYDRSLWTQLQTFNINDAGQDPWWRIKQSTNAPSSGIVFACQEGDIKRSTDGGVTFATVSPDDPPNDAGDAPAPTAGDLSFIQYDGDLYTQDQHCFLARWQNGSSEWRTWLYSTDDDCSTWNVEFIGGAGGGSGAFGTAPGGVDGADLHPSAPYRSMVAMDNNTVVVVYLDSTPTNPSLNAIVGSISGGSISYGSPIVIRDNSTADPQQYTVIKMDDTRILVAYKLDAGPSDQYDGLLRVGTVSGSTITFGAEYTFLDYSAGGYDSKWNGMVLGRLTDDKAILTFCPEHPAGAIFAVNPGFHALTVNLSGTTISSVGTIYTFLGSTQIMIVDNSPLSSSTVAAFVGYRAGTSASYLYAYGAVLNVSADVITIGSTYALETTNQCRLGAVCPVDTNRAMFAYQENDGSDYIVKAHIGSISGTVITVGGENVIETMVAADYEYGRGFGLEQIDTDRVIMSYIYTQFVPFAQNPGIKILSSSVYTITVDLTDLSTEETSEEQFVCAVPLSALAFAQVYGDTSTTQGIVRTIGSLSEEHMALGLSIAKGGGQYVYATTLDVGSGQIILHVLEFPSLTYVESWLLGSANEAEVNARTWWAYPYCPVGFDDGEVIIFGRMNNAAGLGTTHVLYSPDYGATMATMEDGWGNDHCGAITADEYGYLFIIRNIAGASAKLYYAIPAGTLELLSTVGMPGGINPQALRVDFFGNIIAAADQPQSVMVMYSAPLAYAVWENITFNHGTTRAVNSVVVL